MKADRRGESLVRFAWQDTLPIEYNFCGYCCIDSLFYYVRRLLLALRSVLTLVNLESSLLAEAYCSTSSMSGMGMSLSLSLRHDGGGKNHGS